MIAAMSTNRVIGINNDLPWHLPDDFKFFQTKTKGHHVLMGRKNYESLPPKFRPLPNRINLIITKNNNYQAENTYIFHSLEKAIEYAEIQGEQELFIIGGGEIYQLALPYADTIYLTEVDASLTVMPTSLFLINKFSKKHCDHIMLQMNAISTALIT